MMVEQVGLLVDGLVNTDLFEDTKFSDYMQIPDHITVVVKLVQHRQYSVACGFHFHDFKC